MASEFKVLRVNGAEETNKYRDAVAEIIQRIITENNCTLIDIAERVSISLGTVSNAFNKKADLSSTFLTRLAITYGYHVLDPFLALSGARAVPRQGGSGRDLLPFLNRAMFAIVQARDPDGPTKGRETHVTRFGYLPILHDLSRELSATIVEIEDERARMVSQ